MKNAEEECVFIVGDANVVNDSYIALTSGSFVSPGYESFFFKSVRRLEGWDRLRFNLTRVNVSENRLTSLGDLSPLVSLARLDCSDNRLSSIDGLSALTKLESLNCSDNNLVGELAGLSRLVGLDLLNCRNNKLTSLNGLSTTVSYLFCSCNELRWLPDLSKHPVIHRVETFQNSSLPSYMQFGNNYGFAAHKELSAVCQRIHEATLIRHCRVATITVLGVAKKRKYVRDIMFLIARDVWATRTDEYWGD